VTQAPSHNEERSGACGHAARGDGDQGPAVSDLSALLWLLDHHRLLCGNALDAAAFAELMGKERATMVFSDPPYSVRIDGHASGLGAIHHRPFPMASGEIDRTEFTAFLGQAFRNLASFSIDGSLAPNAPPRATVGRRRR
jgi:hypothetical protein